MFAPTRVRIEKDVITRINRTLKGVGTIHVQVGQQITPSEIIGTSQVSSGFRKINLALFLGVAPKDVGKYLRRSIGQRIYKDELLAYKSSFLMGKRVITSPTDGILDFLNPQTGELQMKFLPKKEELPSGVYGIVEAIDKEKGIVSIRTQVTIVHGMFGSGRVRDGILHIVSKRDQLVDESLISPKYVDNILVGGSVIFKQAITASISNGVSGIVIGGINAKDYKSMAGGKLVFPKKLENDIGTSLIICEGFGSISLGEDIFEILKQFEGKYALVNGNKGEIILPSFQSKSLIKVKNSKLPPNISTEVMESEREPTEVKLGLKVRVVGPSFPGEQGKIIALDQVETLMPSGLKSFMVTIETRRRKIKVPIANIEIML